MSRLFRILEDVELVPEGASYALLIRHADREALEDRDAKFDYSLTEKGLRDSRELGRELAGCGIGYAHSSAVARCVATAREILAGAGRENAEVTVRRELGEIAPYTNDPREAAIAFRKYGSVGIVERLAADGGLPGFLPMDQGCRLLMAEVLEDIAPPGTHGLYVSHDMIIIPQILHYIGEKFGRDHWLDCLDGFVIAKTGEGAVIIRNGRSLPLRI